jgi:hypothetical protein
LYIYIKTKNMSYSKEFKEWTNANVESTFSICGEDSIQIFPDQEIDTVKCDGFNIVGLKKTTDGSLWLKIKSDDSEGFTLMAYDDLKSQY